MQFDRNDMQRHLLRNKPIVGRTKKLYSVILHEFVSGRVREYPQNVSVPGTLACWGK